ncbi:MAG: HIT family protein [bacterium]|nr:HIT family protein [bacterium]
MPQIVSPLLQGTRPLVEWELCWLRMLEDPQLPWVLLIPKRDDLTEWYQLSPADQAQLSLEMGQVAKLLSEEFGPDKINLGALGNLVPQLHVHVIGRYRDDRAWPGPIWGVEAPRDAKAVETRYQQMKKLFAAP